IFHFSEFGIDTLENFNLLHGTVSAMGKRFWDHTIVFNGNTLGISRTGRCKVCTGSSIRIRLLYMRSGR
ncbi:hypothetical protein OAH22_02080, partial [bacterium]|nr:hypothetical protein [bacterium]